MNCFLLSGFLSVLIILSTTEAYNRNYRHGYSSPSNLQRPHSHWRTQSQSSGHEDYDQSQSLTNVEDYNNNNYGPSDQVVDEDSDGIQQTVDFEEIPDIIESQQNKQRPTRTPGSSSSKYEGVQPEITTEMGTFKGKSLKTSTGKTVYAFLSIPYAKPPVLNLRFKRPVPAGKLASPYDATELPNACIQESPDIFSGFPGEAMWTPNTNVSEDCLYLNIWVPEEVVNNKDQELASVLFWIYGGGFFSGSSSLDIYNGANLASQESLIVVSSQYRVGPLGFLYLGTEDIPGNVGLWDQNLALKWVHDHIENFGGDPNSVTLFGESGGSASVGYHLLSPVSRNFFKRAVMMSGLPGEDYSFVPPNVLRHRTYKLAKLAGCDPRKAPADVAACLRNIDPEVLSGLQWRFFKKMLQFAFTPTVDGSFLRDSPTNLLSNGESKRADLIVGTVQDEGSYFVLYKYLKYFYHDKPTSISYDRFIDIMKEIFGDYSELEQDAIITYYTNWKNPEDGILNQQRIVDAVGDAFFVCPIRKFADTWSNRGLKVFYYHFTQRSSSNPWAKWMGVMHADDIEYILGRPLNNSGSYTLSEQQLSIYMMKMLSNFAKLGVPSEKWTRYSFENPIYLDLNATKPSDQTTSNQFGPRPDHCALWNRLLEDIRRNSMRRPTHQHCQRAQNQFDEYLPSVDHPSMHWRHRGVHGGQGFQINTYDHYVPSENTIHCSPSMPTTPIAPAAPKFGHNKPTHGFGQNIVQSCKSCCENSEPTSTPTPAPL